MKIINNTIDLSDFCHAIISANPKFIALDTEFISDHRHFPKLCLIQICYNTTAVLIDVLAEDLDLSILDSLFANQNIIKVFHDFKQDILALLTIFDYLPYPMMDTQIMAMLCRNYSHSISYADLVYSLLNIKISKETTRTNWLIRPLSQKQIRYAISDVTYLCSVYENLYNRLVKLDRLKWVKEDIAAMTDKLAIPYSSKNELPSVVRQVLCSYRSRELLIDKVSDVQIYRLSYAKKISKKLFADIVKKDYLDELVSFLINCKEDNIDNRSNKAIVCLIQSILQQHSIENDLSYQLLSSSAEVKRLVGNDLSDVRLLHGWRYKEIGHKIIDLLKGNIQINVGINNRKLQIKYS